VCMCVRVYVGENLYVWDTHVFVKLCVCMCVYVKKAQGVCVFVCTRVCMRECVRVRDSRPRQLCVYVCMCERNTRDGVVCVCV